MSFWRVCGGCLMMFALDGCGLLNPYLMARQHMAHQYFGHNYWNCWGPIGAKYQREWCEKGGDDARAKPDLDACYDSLRNVATLDTSEDEAEGKLIACMQHKGWQFFGPPVLS